MPTTISILARAFFLLESLVYGLPPLMPPGQLINAGSTPATAVSEVTVLNGTALNGIALNGTAMDPDPPLPPYETWQCGVYRPAPLQHCINALIQFPFKSGGGEFHPSRPHDPDPDFALGQVRKWGQCRVFIDLLDNKTPAEWSWDNLANYIWGFLDSCTENKRAPTAQWVTGGDLQIRLNLWVPGTGLKISVRSTEVQEEGHVDLA